MEGRNEMETSVNQSLVFEENLRNSQNKYIKMKCIRKWNEIKTGIDDEKLKAIVSAYDGDTTVQAILGTG